MKAVAYSIKTFEKEFLAKANNNALSIETAIYSQGKEAVIVSVYDDVSEKIIDLLAGFAVKYIATRSLGTDHIDKAAAAKHGIKIANVPYYSTQAPSQQIISLTQQICLTHEELQQIADQTIRNLDLWQQGKCTGKACCCTGNSFCKP